MIPACYDAVFCARYAGNSAAPKKNSETKASYPSDPKQPGTPHHREFTPRGDLFPASQVDWQLALRGAYRVDAGVSSYELVAAPSVSVMHKARGREVNIDAGLEIVAPLQDTMRVRSGDLSLQAAVALDAQTLGQFRAGIEISQADTGDSSLPAGISIAPVVVSGAAEATVTRQFGSFFSALRGSVDRDVYGDSGLAAGGWQGNSDRNRTGLEAGLRLGSEVAAHVNAFVEGGVRRDLYDAASTTFGVKADSWTYLVKTGLTGNWHDVVTGEISAGYTYRQYDNGAFADVHATLADAHLTYSPDDAVAITASLGTKLSADDPATGASSRVDYSAGIDAHYLINSRLTLRGQLGADLSLLHGMGQTETVWRAGTGADFALNAHTDINADYSYAYAERVTGPSDSHTVSLGVNFKR
jgi:hypothetical protein